MILIGLVLIWRS